MEELETENLPGILNFFELPIPVRLRIAYIHTVHVESVRA